MVSEVLCIIISVFGKVWINGKWIFRKGWILRIIWKWIYRKGRIMKINEWIFGENWKMSDMDKVRLNN